MIHSNINEIPIKVAGAGREAMSDYERQGTAYDPHAVGHEKVGRDTATAGFITMADVPMLTLSSASVVVLTITHDGRLEPGPGLSMDEATRAGAEMLVKHFGEAIVRPNTDLMAAAEALADSVLFDDVGEMIGGKLVGGNGGLLSRETIAKADAVRRALDVLRK
jgi:hypothetical protein